jgi:hypothetical protein
MLLVIKKKKLINKSQKLINTKFKKEKKKNIYYLFISWILAKIGNTILSN